MTHSAALLAPSQRPWVHAAAAISSSERLLSDRLHLRCFCVALQTQHQSRLIETHAPLISVSAGQQTSAIPSRYIYGMDDKFTILEVAFFSGRVLVTFADGMMALFEPGQIRQFAEHLEALKPIPKGLLDFD
jgi:hypothetical protein